ncbi:MAG: sulfatase [Bradymonadaceae bacterium]|nr:sulfatase [Lujinxingiaceae bacterium]
MRILSPADLLLLLVAAIIQTLFASTVFQLVEGWYPVVMLSIYQSLAYALTTTVVVGLSIAAGRAVVARLTRLARPVLLGGWLLVGFSLVTSCFYLVGRVLSIEGFLVFALMGASLVLGALSWFVLRHIERLEALLGCALCWFVALPLVVDTEHRYRLIAAMSDRFMDANAMMLLALLGLLGVAGVAMAPWFERTDQGPTLAGRRFYRVAGLASVVLWVAIVIWNRTTLVPRLYPDLHEALACLELLILAGTLRWLWPRWHQSFEQAVSEHRWLLKAVGAFALCSFVALFTFWADPQRVAPRRVDYSASMFARPWVWLFDRDGDGYMARRMGDVDCDDSQSSAYPLGREIAANGVDESCSGSDLDAERALQALTPPQIVASKPADLTIIITIDMLRPDFMGVYGFDEQTTPFLSRTAAEWTRFEMAYTSGGITTLGLPSMLSGRIPLALDFEPIYRTVAMRYRLADAIEADDVVNRVFTSPRSDNHPTVAGVFAAAGRRTFGLVDDGPDSVFQKGLGYEKGFDTFFYPNVPEGPGHPDWNSRTVTDSALALFDDIAPGSLVWIHYYDPHAAFPPCRQFGPTTGLGCYRDTIFEVDALIGELAARLGELGRWDNSAVIITSDHGEALGEHGLRHHGVDSFEEFVRIPLLLKAAGGQDHARTFAEPVSLIDVSVTALAVAGLQPPASFQGEDLRALVAGQPRRFPVISQALVLGVDGRAAYQQSLLIEGSTRYMYDRITQRQWLYDLATDPEQRRSLSGVEVDGEHRSLRDFQRTLYGWLDLLEARSTFSRATKFP